MESWTKKIKYAVIPQNCRGVTFDIPTYQNNTKVDQAARMLRPQAESWFTHRIDPAGNPRLYPLTLARGF